LSFKNRHPEQARRRKSGSSNHRKISNHERIRQADEGNAAQDFSPMRRKNFAAHVS